MTCEELAIQLAQVREQCHGNSDRITVLEHSTDVLNNLAKSVAVVATKQDSMNETLDKLDGKISEIEKKPGKRWDMVVDKVLLLIIAALVVAVLAKIGL